MNKMKYLNLNSMTHNVAGCSLFVNFNFKIAAKIWRNLSILVQQRTNSHFKVLSHVLFL